MSMADTYLRRACEIVTKACRDCEVTKELTDFYKHPDMVDGHMAICKKCHIAKMILHRQTHPHVQEYDRQRAKTPERRALRRALVVKWREKNPEGYKAHRAVAAAIRSGILERGTACETCGTPDNLHAHHDDYAKPLEVRWLCALHHFREHAGEKDDSELTSMLDALEEGF